MLPTKCQTWGELDEMFLPWVHQAVHSLPSSSHDWSFAVALGASFLEKPNNKLCLYCTYNTDSTIQALFTEEQTHLEEF